MVLCLKRYHINRIITLYVIRLSGLLCNDFVISIAPTFFKVFKPRTTLYILDQSIVILFKRSNGCI